MVLGDDSSRSVPVAQSGKNEEQTAPALDGMIDFRARERSFTGSSQPRVRRHHPFLIIGIFLLISLIVGLLGLGMFLSASSASNDQLLVRFSNQETATVDLRQSLPISPYLFGANVFPEVNSNSLDNSNTGFMIYNPLITNGLRAAHIALLRFPGGNWGEEHILSYDQMNTFSTLLTEVGADGIIQARLSGPIGNGFHNLASLAERANLAGRWVDYMNNPHSDQRTGKYAHAPFHPIKFWTVGNEPDLLLNPDTGKPFTVAEYTQAFIQFSLTMHQSDPTIQVFGPEISQFYGVGIGPTDPNGQLWMESFLKGVGTYEKAHPELKFHLLDGVSLHRYPLYDARKAPTVLLGSTGEWTYLLPPLRQLIQQDFGREVLIAVTEINTNPTNFVPSRGLAGLWWADTLGTLMDQEVKYVAFFSVEGVDTPYPLFASDGLQQTPMFRVMQVFTHLQHNLILVEAQRDPVSLYVTQDDTHQAVSLLFVNKSPMRQLAQVSAQNHFFGFGNSPWRNVDIRLAGYSLTLVTLHRNGGAEVYSYDAPTTTSSDAGSLNYTVCGEVSNKLESEPPC